MSFFSLSPQAFISTRAPTFFLGLVLLHVHSYSDNFYKIQEHMDFVVQFFALLLKTLL